MLQNYKPVCLILCRRMLAPFENLFDKKKRQVVNLHKTHINSKKTKLTTSCTHRTQITAYWDSLRYCCCYYC